MSGPQRYFVTGMQRSGTSLIHHGVRGHPEISAFQNEVGVTRFFEQGASFFCFDEEIGEGEKAAAPVSLFDCLAGLTADDETRVLGLKSLPLNAGQARRLVNGITAHFPKALILRVKRQDPVARYGSLIKSKKTGIWKIEDTKNKSVNPNPTIYINKYDLIDYILESYRIEKEIDRLYHTHRVFTIDYEDDISDYNTSDWSLFEAVFEFLNVEPTPPGWLHMRKLSPRPEKYVINYSDLQPIATHITDSLREGASPERLSRLYGRPFHQRMLRSLRWHVRHPRITARKVQNLLGFSES